MGYNTDFMGQFELDKPLSLEHKAYLEAFAGTRRMKRISLKTEKLDDPIRKAVGLPVGSEGCYYVGASKENCVQEETSDIKNYASPPSDQPGLWCQWVPNDKGTAIVWDGGEKFYYYIDWIKYLINHFFVPWGYVLNGEVEYVGESGGGGTIVVKDNMVTTK